MPRDARELAGAWTKHQRHVFDSPSPDLAPFVDYYWAASWSYRTPYRQLIVPYPNVHVTFRDGAATVNGVRTGHHVKVLDGDGSVFGVAIRPGCFRAFLGTPVSTITNATLAAGEVFDGDVPAAPDVAVVEAFLRAQKPRRDAKADAAAEAVAAIASNAALTRVDAVARQAGLGVRSLQRLFAEHVGVGPKWVIRRYRLHEVTRPLEQGAEIDWAGLAAALGYADQAHLARDFKEMFGESPTWYARRY
ncbi:MAG: AraC family transcriptional regulator [Stackebrandtia sp.]